MNFSEKGIETVKKPEQEMTGDQLRRIGFRNKTDIVTFLQSQKVSRAQELINVAISSGVLMCEKGTDFEEVVRGTTVTPYYSEGFLIRVLTYALQQQIKEDEVKVLSGFERRKPKAKYIKEALEKLQAKNVARGTER